MSSKAHEIGRRTILKSMAALPLATVAPSADSISTATQQGFTPSRWPNGFGNNSGTNSSLFLK